MRTCSERGFRRDELLEVVVMVELSEEWDEEGDKVRDDAVGASVVPQKYELCLLGDWPGVGESGVV